MSLDSTEIQRAIKEKIVAIAQNLGNDASELAADELIPATGLLDSAALLELIVWYEAHFDIVLKQEEINIDNLGTIQSMTDFVQQRKSA